MQIVLLEIKIDLHMTGGLKYRRKIANSIKDRLKKLNLSIIDISTEYSKEIELAVVYVSPTMEIKDSIKQAIVDILDLGSYEYEYEINELQHCLIFE